MENYSLKNYLEICYLIIYERVNVNDFIEMFKLNYYKFTVDFNKMCEMAPFYGIVVYTEENIITYRITNQKVFFEKRGACVSFYHRNKNRRVSNISLVGVIGEMILQNDDVLTIDSICAKANISRSGIRTDLKTVRTIIESYNIKVMNKPYRGLVKEGKELNIRLALLAFLGFSEKRVVITDLVQYLSKDFFNFELESFIRKEIEKVLEQQEIKMTNPNKRRLARYIIIQKGRIAKEGMLEELDFGMYNQDILMQTKAFHTAKEIYKAIYFGNVFGDNLLEILSLTIMILTHQEGMEQEEEKRLLPVLDFEIQQLTTILIDLFNVEWNLPLNQDEKLMLQEYAKKLCIKNNFRFLSFRAFETYGRLTLLNTNPILTHLLEQARERVMNCIKGDVRTPFMNELAFLLIKKIQEIELDYKKIELYILSSESRIKSEMIKAMLEDKLDSKLISKVSVITEKMNSDLCEEHQLIVYDRSVLANNYLILEEMDRFPQFYQEFIKEIRKKVHLAPLNVKKVVKDMDGETIDEIEQKIKNYVPDVKRADTKFYSIFNDVLVFLSKTEDESLIIAGNLSAKIDYKEREADRYLWLNYNMNNTSLRVMMELLANVVRNETSFEQFIEQDLNLFIKENLDYLI